MDRLCSEAADFEAFRSRVSFQSLDGIRCVSILAVIWHHTEAGWVWLPASRRGFLGVDMFFVLSGFLIVTLLLRERRAEKNISLRGFYTRRVLRIFPIYFGLLGVLALSLSTFLSGRRMAASFFTDLPFLVSYTSNWVECASILAISWSLSAEEQFYLLWPPVEHYLRRAAIPILAGVIALNQAINFGMADGWFGGWLGARRPHLAMLQATFTPICLGVALAHLLDTKGGFAVARSVLGRRWSALYSLFILLALSNVPTPDISGWIRLCSQLAMMLVLCSCVVREDHALVSILTVKPVRWIGQISYGMYLYHLFCRHPAALAMQHLQLDVPGLLFASCTALTVAIASLSYRYYERPFLALKGRFARGVTGGRRRTLERSGETSSTDEIVSDHPTQPSA